MLRWLLAALTALLLAAPCEARTLGAGQIVVADLDTCAGLTKMSPSQGAQVVAMSCTGVASTAPSGASVTASYTGVEMSGPIRQMCASFAFPPAGNPYGAAVLIANRGGLATVQQITNGALHIVFTPMEAQVTYFEAGVYNVVAVVDYSAPLPLDGSYHYGCLRILPDGVVLTNPDGRVHYVSSPGISARAGRFGQFEAYRGDVGAPLAVFGGVWFESE